VKAGASAQFRQGEMGVFHTECREDAHRSTYGHYAFFCRGLLNILSHFFVHWMEHVSSDDLALYWSEHGFTIPPPKTTIGDKS
jgi:hypothetical protein